MDDSELLRCYADQRSEAAFRELVGRHVDVVYSAALRQVGGDAHLAKDVAQKVFVALARKAGTLRDRPVLVLQYARMYKQLNLSPGKIRQLESIMEKENSSSGMGKELDAQIHQLLGDDGTKQYYDFKRSVALHNVVDTVSTDTYAGSESFTAAQSDQLFNLLIANDPNYQNGHGTDVSQVNWEAVWEPAGKILSPDQLGYFQATVEAQVLKMQVQAALKSGQGAAGQ